MLSPTSASAVYPFAQRSAKQDAREAQNNVSQLADIYGEVVRHIPSDPSGPFPV